MEIIERKNAAAAGLSTYYTGRLCKNGHLTHRYTSSGSCAKCIQSSKSPAPVKIEMTERRLKIRETETELRKQLAERRTAQKDADIALRQQLTQLRIAKAARLESDRETRAALKLAAETDKTERMRVALETQAAAKKLEGDRDAALNELAIKQFKVPELNWSEFRDDLVAMTQAIHPSLGLSDIAPRSDKKQVDPGGIGGYMMRIPPTIVAYAYALEGRLQREANEARNEAIAARSAGPGSLNRADVGQYYDHSAKRWLCKLIDTQNDGKLAEINGLIYKLDDLEGLLSGKGIYAFKVTISPFSDPVILPDWMSDDKQREDD